MAAEFVAAIDHGTTSTRCILFDALGSPIATAQRGQTMHYPRPGWVELDMEEVWNRTQECIHAVLRVGRRCAGGRRRDRDHQRARVGGPVGSADGTSGRACDRLAGHPDGRRRRRARRRRRHPPPPGSHRPADLDLLLRPEARMAARPGPGHAGGGRPGGPPVRHPGHLAALEPHRRSGRRGARHRSDECMSHPPDEPAHARMGFGPARPPADPACAASGDPLFERGVWQGGGRLVRGARRGRPRRPVGLAVRSHVLRPRRHEEHLRHRSLPALHPRNQAGDVRTRPDHHRRMEAR